MIMHVRICALLTCVSILLSCSKKKADTIDTKSSLKFNVDSASKEILQIFSIVPNGNYEYDSTHLYFYCRRNYDTTSLIEMEKRGKLISVLYYQILPEYHRFTTDFADKNSKLIFFEGYSFMIDSLEWNAIVNQAKLVLQEKSVINGNIPKSTDGNTYALLYNNQIQRGYTGDMPLENFDVFLKSLFLSKYLKLKKPIMKIK